MSSTERHGSDSAPAEVVPAPPFADIKRRIDGFGVLQEAQDVLTASYFPQIAKRFAATINAVTEESDPELSIRLRPTPLFSKESAFVAINWDEQRKKGRRYEQKSVFIEAFPNGSIIVHGNQLGSTILTKDDLEGNRRVQVAALKKALRQPMKTNFFSIR